MNIDGYKNTHYGDLAVELSRRGLGLRTALATPTVTDLAIIRPLPPATLIALVSCHTSPYGVIVERLDASKDRTSAPT